MVAQEQRGEAELSPELDLLRELRRTGKVFTGTSALMYEGKGGSVWNGNGDLVTKDMEKVLGVVFILVFTGRTASGPGDQWRRSG